MTVEELINELAKLPLNARVALGVTKQEYNFAEKQYDLVEFRVLLYPEMIERVSNGVVLHTTVGPYDR